jgi:uncharacterized protein with ParB-like and HNH nuclease domain
MQQQLIRDLSTGKVLFDSIKVLPRSGYCVAMGWEYLKKWLKEQEEELGLQLNPDFQRGHVWTSEQQIKFIEYCLQEGKSALNVYFNYPGWMGDWGKHRGYNDFVCVDGLQRITAVFDFLDNKVPVFGDFYYKDFDYLSLSTAILNINIATLRTEKEILEWYLAINAGGTVHSTDELTKVENMIKELGV